MRFLLNALAKRFDILIGYPLPKCFSKKSKKFLFSLSVVNIFILIISINSVTIVTDNYITVRNITHFTGKSYIYDNVSI